MKIPHLIIVDDLPESCDECAFRYDNYCNLKSCTTIMGYAWIDRHKSKRDEECPLREAPSDYVDHAELVDKVKELELMLKKQDPFMQTDRCNSCGNHRYEGHLNNCKFKKLIGGV